MTDSRPSEPEHPRATAQSEPCAPDTDDAIGDFTPASGTHDNNPARVAVERVPRPARHWWQAVVQWRDWRLPVKVAAVLVVPSIAAVTLGALQVNGDIANASTYTRIQQLVTLRDSLTTLADDLQTERLLAAEKLGTSTPVDVPTYFEVNNQVDTDAQTVSTLGRQLLGPTTPAGVRFQILAGQLANLGELHQVALTGGADVDTLLSDYDNLIGSVLDFEQAFNTQLANPTLTADATALTDLEIAQEQVRLQQAIITVAIPNGQIPDTELITVRSSEALLTDRFGDLQVDAAPAEVALFQRSAVTTAINTRDRLVQAVLAKAAPAQPAGRSLGVAAADWAAASNAAADQLAGIENPLAGQLRNTSAALRDQARRAALLETGAVALVLLLAIGIGIIIGRQLLRSLGILRRAALEVAEYRLPEVVATIDKGDLSDQRIEPVPVYSREEFGELARAFDAVHAQAVRSAVGQATLRSNLRNIFVNLSRRSQSLVERQLRLMEKLEHNEEDPQQLANLFRLDHLATRMRRNNENLMVLSGDDPARRSGQPLPLADVLRAAVSEIEQYQRVVVRSTPSVDVLGYASGDLVRLVAELLDNATTFSPPRTHVRIGGQSHPDGSVRIEIHDEGIGMAEPELAQANAKVTAADTDVPVSRQMGLYVVGRLANRHSIDVLLEGRPDGGLLAAVRVPAELMKSGAAPTKRADAAVPATEVGDRAESAGNGHVTSGLLPAFPSPREWHSFAGANIADSQPVDLEPSGFTWFAGKETRAEPTPPEPVNYTAVGLPRRVPRANAVPSLVPPGAGRQPAASIRTTAEPSPPTTSGDPIGALARRSPTKARGFLNDYQAGIRQGRPEPQADEPGQGEGDAP